MFQCMMSAKRTKSVRFVLFLVSCVRPARLFLAVGRTVAMVSQATETSSAKLIQADTPEAA